MDKQACNLPLYTAFQRDTFLSTVLLVKLLLVSAPWRFLLFFLPQTQTQTQPHFLFLFLNIQLHILQGSMKPVINCLLTLRAEFITGGDNIPMNSMITKSGSRHGDASSHGHLSPLFGEERRKVSSESQLQRHLHSPVMSGIITSWSPEYMDLKQYAR